MRVTPSHGQPTKRTHFIGPNVRNAVQSGWVDFTPIMLARDPATFHEGYLLF